MGASYHITVLWGPPIVLHDCVCLLSYYKIVGPSILLQVFFLTFYHLNYPVETGAMTCRTNQFRRIRKVLADFQLQLLKIIQQVFCKIWSCDIVVKNNIFPICRNRLFFLISCIEIGVLVAMLFCSYCFAGSKKLKANYPSAISPNFQQRIHLMQVLFRHEHSTFIRVPFTSSVCPNININDPVFLVSINSFQERLFSWSKSKLIVIETRSGIYRSLRVCGTHVSSLAMNPSLIR